jgi:phage-related protein
LGKSQTDIRRARVLLYRYLSIGVDDALPLALLYKNTYNAVMAARPKALVWMGSSRRDIRAMPKEIRRSFGIALYAVQIGETPPIAKVLKGFGGAGVLELIEDDAGGTYRAVYTVRHATAVYVLHVFQKKSKRGKATPQRDMDLINERLKRAGKLHAMKMKESGQ